jgi:hypothetical protein
MRLGSHKTILVLTTVLSVLLTAGPAFGFAYSYYSGFGASVFDANNNTSPINYPGVGYLPSPGNLGEGGEGFDEEGMFVELQSGRVFGALTNSFGSSAYSSMWHETYQTGHLFFGFNGVYDQFAIDLDEGTLYKVNAWDYIPDLPGTYYNNTAIRDAVGAFRMTDGVEIGSLSDFMMTHLTDYEGLVEGKAPLSSGSADTYIYEWAIDMSLLMPYLNEQATSVTFHHTLACGNDLIERDAAIPEPATLILFGSGLIGFGLYHRRRKKK